MSELNHECGVAAIYHLPGETSPLCPSQGPDEVSRLVPRMLLDIQNRGQLSAGMTSYQPDRPRLLETYRELGTVSEVFRLSRQGKFEKIMRDCAGRAAIGHVRYATCGADDRNFAQPFERKHIQKHKWFSFAFNGQVTNYAEMKAEILADDEYHLSRDVDTEIILHEISRQFAGDRRPSLFDVCRSLSRRIDGAFSLALLNAAGEMLIARDPLGIKPMCYARQGNLFAAASESVALLNLGFDPSEIHSLEPGCAIVVTPDGKVDMQRFADSRRAHCFFEWIYFANVASTMDGRSVYLSRKHLGEELAHYEKEEGLFPIKDDGDTIVVPVPDTSKAAADAMAFALRLPCLEGLIRNRYTGRTFIESTGTRKQKASLKYTPLREVLEGKRVILVEDSIVRSTTMKVLLKRVRELGKAREIHVRIACPPIVAPCFYGIDMSTINELFAPRFLKDAPATQHGRLSREVENQMAAELGADSLRYLPVDSIARALNFREDQLCRACITGEYPTAEGQRLYQLAFTQPPGAAPSGRAYESPPNVPVTMR